MVVRHVSNYSNVLPPAYNVVLLEAPPKAYATVLFIFIFCKSFTSDEREEIYVNLIFLKITFVDLTLACQMTNKF